ncbi:MAG: helix-turn-helix transcriptional regulator [Schleiferilactobacillus harbinensis]|jgi:transcriptional regulator with XRE-family HTH domain|nr:helix-turn-helix transcriptional regulator [Schleiferilactobacillus harbinensis]
MNHHDLFITRLEKELEQRNMTMNGLAKISGVTQSTLSNMVNRPNAVPRLDTMYSIANGLGMTFTEFFDFPPYNQRPDGSSAAKQRSKWEELGNALTPEERERVRRILMGNDKGELK